MGTQRNNNIIMTSKRCCDVVLTYYIDFIIPLCARWAQRTHDAIMSLWSQNDAAMLFWCHNDIIFAPCARWVKYRNAKSDRLPWVDSIESADQNGDIETACPDVSWLQVPIECTCSAVAHTGAVDEHQDIMLGYRDLICSSNCVHPQSQLGCTNMPPHWMSLNSCACAVVGMGVGPVSHVSSDVCATCAHDAILTCQVAMCRFPVVTITFSTFKSCVTTGNESSFVSVKDVKVKFGFKEAISTFTCFCWRSSSIWCTLTQGMLM